jgi:hypothetical protein
MFLTSLKVWQWTLIGAAVGAVLALAGPSASRDWLADQSRTMGQKEFEAALLSKTAQGRPALTDLVVHPRDSTGNWWITARWTQAMRVRQIQPDGRSRKVEGEMASPVKFRAGDPYVPMNPALKNATDSSIFGVLDAASKLPGGRGLSYRYAWQERPIVFASIWVLGFMAMIGGVWPVVLGSLVAAGFGPLPEEKGGHLPPGRSQERERFKRAMADADALLALIEGYETDLEKTADGAAPQVVNGSSSPAPVIAKLTGDATAAPAPAAPGEPQEFGGEFYPTEAHPDQQSDPALLMRDNSE